MASAYSLPSNLSPATVANTSSLLRIVALALISGAAIASRLFAVINFESIIHELCVYVDYRVGLVYSHIDVLQRSMVQLVSTMRTIITMQLKETRFPAELPECLLLKASTCAFWNWFDPTAWYPLGRVVGGTIYPGLMATSGVIYNVLHALNLPVDIRNICVLLAPGFSALTAWATYMFTKEMKDESAGLLAAAFIGIAPGYISRSVAGSYDNEAIAIFLLMFTFYCWIKALKMGSAFYGTLTALFYFYMVAAWGGYAFITNMIPLHALSLILMGRFSSRLYVAYSSWYAIGTLASMQVPFVGFQPIVAFAELVRTHVSSKQFQSILFATVIGTGIFGACAFAGLTYKGWIAPWTGRFYSLWDTGYAKKYPITGSNPLMVLISPVLQVHSHHRVCVRTSADGMASILHGSAVPNFRLPRGRYLCFRQLRDEHVFVIIYAVVASYFAGVMVRLMLTLTPVVCVSAAVALSSLLDTYIDPAEPRIQETTKGAVDSDIPADTPVNGASTLATPTSGSSATAKKAKKSAAAPSAGPLGDLVSTVAAAVSPSKKDDKPHGIFGLDTRLMVILNALGMLLFFVMHCTYVTSSAYSSPSVVLASQNPDGSQHIIDDFREAYYWLRQNTPETAVVMSWWDYGYQIAGMADRPTLVDNNTWNNTHIATVGKAMSSPEEVAYPILRKHDVDYVLIIFGGLIGYSGDDINKFLWMVRIAQGVWPDEIQEPNYFTPKGEYRVDEAAPPAMKNSLMYKMSYYRFAELFGGNQAVDRVRGQQVPLSGPTLDYLDEAFTSENWIVRIYQVKKDDLLGRDLKSANTFAQGKKRKRTKPPVRRRAVV
ncbi:Dolichyl-diphosphooligosaccharide--protein glycosyltransferase subunit stt3 [Grifola frondosa]|uniref:Dolichyl-diphosphooligosaccharide--protein glycosyltransferase subunit STT3 n=1 Tax=Grifola frondosa TaxID=5627 RepID=A0A1C7M9Y8_GRIFR|nr:Dolichyl-diphosphooligosaccharide--protein glycosyltransferase subunit stt3 [Grifola frondosa]